MDHKLLGVGHQPSQEAHALRCRHRRQIKWCFMYLLYASPMMALEANVMQLESQLRAERKEHAAELAEYGKRFEAQVTRLLAAKGIGLADLLRSDTEPKAVQAGNASRGRALKELREKLGMTQQAAGKLLKPALSQSQVSVLEATGAGGEELMFLEVLLAERLKKSKRAFGGRAGEENGVPRPDMAGEPLTL